MIQADTIWTRQILPGLTQGECIYFFIDGEYALRELYFMIEANLVGKRVLLLWLLRGCYCTILLINCGIIFFSTGL